MDPPSRGLPAALDEFDPDVVVYNAGTDILEGDRLGNMDITPEVRGGGRERGDGGREGREGGGEGGTSHLWRCVIILLFRE